MPLRVGFDKDVWLNQDQTLHLEITLDKRNQRHLGLKALHRDHLRPKAPWRVGEAYPLHHYRGRKKTGEIQISLYANITAGGLLDLLGDEGFVLVEFSGSDGHHDGDDQRDDRNNTKHQDCAKRH